MIKGKNVQLLNVTYVRPNRDEGIEECFRVIYKTPDDQVYYSDEPAEATIWFTKPEFRTHTYNKPQEEIAKMYSKRVKISKIRDTIYQESGDYGKAIYSRASVSGDKRLRNQVFKWPYVYGADFQPEYYYMHDWYQTHELGTPKLTKAYLDIEVDQADYKVNMDNLENSANAPVNAVTVIMEQTKEAVLFVLRPYEPPVTFDRELMEKRRAQYKKQKEDHDYIFSHLDEFTDKLHKMYDGIYGVMNYKIREYEREIDLIADVFRFINTRKPNYCLIWNMRFDIQYMYYRIRNLGYDPASVMCHWDFNHPTCRFIVDRSTFLIEKQYDYFYNSSYTQFICQMRLNMYGLNKLL